ncbi:hypothetical protein [Pendulispora albinea]|uniref:Uncharacterized protein n=1 Tax=Pendulispora albinea TaxID=2741071 RepID=A0ABZ2LR81_9BACT
MATKKTETLPRGAALIKKSIEAAKASGSIESPEPLPAGVLKKLRLPNDEKISPAMKELLAFDASWLGWSFDDEEPEFEPMSLEELIEEEFGEDEVAGFGEAIKLLGEDCIQLPSDDDDEARHFLYIGSPDDRGEYPVITVALDDEGAQVSGFVPFDVWVAMRLGALEKPAEGAVAPVGYEAACKALADENGDGRVSFTSEEGDEGDDDDDDDDEDEDEDDEDEDEDEDELDDEEDSDEEEEEEEDE